MRGITPVIAIILLLLMAVAAAGGFYFVYQGFTESGEESGSTQIEQLGEQSLAAIQIESAAGGRIYIKNVGAGDVDLSKATLYVENQPVNVNRSSDTLAERSRAVLKLTEAPGCSSDKCEVKISGAASTSKSVDLAKLLCSSDSDCYSSETCEGGICVESGEEGTACGDGTCDSGEDGENCFSDCGPRSLALLGMDLAGGDVDVYSYDWDGSTFVKGENLSAGSPANEVMTYNEFDSQGSGLAVGRYTGGEMKLFASEYDGTSWSTVENISEHQYSDQWIFSGMDFNSSDEAIFVWDTGSGDNNVAWASHDGEWELHYNLTDNPPGVTVYVSDFTFMENDKGLAVWDSGSDDFEWVNYSLWDDGWVETGWIAEMPAPSGGFEMMGVGSNSTHAMAVWKAGYGHSEPNNVIQWSVWEGTGWSEPQNVSDTLFSFGDFPSSLASTEDGWLLAYPNGTSSPHWYEWFEWDGGWVHKGNLTEENLGLFTIVENENDALMGYFLSSFYEPSHFIYWDGTGWSETVDFA